MLIINKDSVSTRWIVTAMKATGSLTVELHSGFTNKSFQFGLPANTSPHTSRYDEFTFLTSSLPELDEGLYTYTINQADAVLKQGMLKVLSNPTQADTYTAIERGESEDDFLVYEPLCFCLKERRSLLPI